MRNFHLYTICKMSEEKFSIPRYFGNKWRLVGFLEKSMEKYGIDLQNVHSVADLFSGSGVTSWMFSNLPNIENIWVNDIEPYANVLTQARLTNDANVDTRLSKYMVEATKLASRKSYHGGWITAHNTHVDAGRQLFSKDKARILDALSRVIPLTDVPAMASLLECVLKQSNCLGGMHNAMNKAYARKSPVKLVKVLPSGYAHTKLVIKTTNVNATELSMKKVYDIIYIDPPYTVNSNYSMYYSLFNTLVLKDDPKTKGKQHVRQDIKSSDFILKSKCYEAFNNLIQACKCNYICISYSTYALLKLSDLKQILTAHGFLNVKVYKKTLPKYKSKTEEVSEILVIASMKRK